MKKQLQEMNEQPQQMKEQLQQMNEQAPQNVKLAGRGALVLQEAASGGLLNQRRVLQLRRKVQAPL